VASGAAIELAGLRSELWRRLARELERWRVRPLYACVFGSGARQEGNAESDIDLLIIRPSTLSEVNEAQKNKSLWAAVGIWTDVISTRVMSTTQVKNWEANVDRLHDLVRRWTGNPLQVVNISAIEWSDLRRKKSPTYMNIVRDEIRLYDELGPLVYKYPNTRTEQ
jgi:predicted nucleotidyltransferase